MNLFHRLCARNDRRRARDTLQEFCDDRVKALRALDEAHRQAARALREASKLDAEQFRESFFGQRDPVHAGFFEGSAKLFGITEPTRVSWADFKKPGARALRVAA
jgi:Zn-dependent oligopeptidase